MEKKVKKMKERIIDLFKGIFGSKRRSRLGVGVQTLNPECPRAYRKWNRHHFFSGLYRLD